MASKSNINSFTQKRIAIGSRIKQARDYTGYTQQKVADELTDKFVNNKSKKGNISAQSISYWENGSFLPSTENLILLSEVLGVSVSSLVEERVLFKNWPKKEFFDIDTTYKRVLKTISMYKLKNSIKALSFAKKAHDGQLRKNSDIPYITHPLNMVCHMLAMGVKDDDVIAATLLHDVMEDCCVVDDKVMPTSVAISKKLDYRQVEESDLPVDKKTATLVKLTTHTKVNDNNRYKMLKKYYDDLSKNPKAALIKLVDRCNNISTMSWGLSHDRIHRMIDETEEYVLPLLNSLKNSEYDNAKYLLAYQIQTTLDIYKRLM